jgi:serine/threonine-protein kinase RsbW
MTGTAPNVRLNVAGIPANVVLVREMLAGVAEAIALDDNDFNDLRTAVGEACNNVVVHAYRGEQGPLEVEVHLPRGALQVVVRDHGVGIHPRSEDLDTTQGIGLHVIDTLTHAVEFGEGGEGGTEVRMEFAVPHSGLPPPGSADPGGIPLPSPPHPATTALSIAPVVLARSVLPRVLCTLAAHADFSTDRISDAQLLADALVAHARGTVDSDHVDVAVHAEARELELRIAPLAVGGGEGLIGASNLDGLGPVIEKLVDRHSVASVGSYEVLTLNLADRPAGSGSD